ncbi:three-Cys-motif partner protein TcmP [Uliginosibacterium gangwonense]|uniref:three-Cys-motif partner protein TcmP n=1 Tax=Uliginosibacterium gangwonense TaxID=392736 RepID=UPI00037EF6FF|nr:three-Cys-motif partner protein TcmP [Uliginosibacterium gangwonense]
MTKKKKKKYEWELGKAPPVLQQHSAVKHRIIESYVRNYVQTVMAPATIPRLQLTLVDGFSGGGCYLAENGSGFVDGSPLLMMRAVREARARLNLGRNKLRDIVVNYELIDIEPKTVEYLHYWIAARNSEGLLDQVDVQRAAVKRASFLDELPRIKASIKARKMGERAIFVLDQYNYDDLPMEEMAGILREIKKSEIILTFNVGSLMTFISDQAANRKPMVRIGLERYIPWQDIGELKAGDSQKWRQVLQRHVAHGIKSETGARYATLFFVKPLGSNTWDYWLIHLCNNYKAHEVMKDLHWEHATEFGHELEPGVFMQGYDANRDQDYTQQSPFDFGPGSRELCVDGIREFMGRQIYAHDKPVTLRELIEGCVSRSPGSTQHFLEAAHVLHTSQDIVVCDASGCIRRPSKNYNFDDVVEPSRLIRLFS